MVSTIRAFLAPFRETFVTLLGGLGGAALAWFWFQGRYMLAAGVVLGAILIVTWSQVRAPRLILRDPVGAIRHYDRLLWAYVALTALTSAAVIVLVVSFAWANDADAELKQTVGAVSAALTTFLGSIMVSSEKADAAIGSIAQRAFEARFDALTDPDGQPRWNSDRTKLLIGSNSPVWTAVGEDVDGGLSGWGRQTRLERARIVEAGLPS